MGQAIVAGISFLGSIAQTEMQLGGGRAQQQMAKAQAISLDMENELIAAKMAWNKDITAANIAMQMEYARHLLQAGDVDIAAVNLAADRAARQVQEEAGAMIGAQTVRAAAGGVAMSGTALQQIMNTADLADRQLEDIQLARSLEISNAFLRSRSSSFSAKMTTKQLGMQSIMDTTMYRNAMLSNDAEASLALQGGKFAQRASQIQAGSTMVQASANLVGSYMVK